MTIKKIWLFRTFWISLGLGIFNLLPACTEKPLPITESSESKEDQALKAFVYRARIQFEQNSLDIPHPDFSKAVQIALEQKAKNRLTHRWVKAFYAKHGYQPILLPRGQWNDFAQEVMNALSFAHDHGLDGPYPKGSDLYQRAEALHHAAQGALALSQFKPTLGDWRQVYQNLRKEGFEISNRDKAMKILFQRLTLGNEQNPMPRLAGRIRNIQWSNQTWESQCGILEVELVLALADYAAEMRLAYPENTPRLDSWRKVLKRSTLLNARLGAFFELILRGNGHFALQSLIPPHPGYLPLVNARKFYFQLAKAGGWPNLSFSSKKVKKIKVGHRGPLIKAIKMRLAIEGYNVGTLDDLYDRNLVKAIKVYQRTHQYSENGKIDKSLLKNLNLPAIDRLAKIDITLKRYRKSRTGLFPYYILVNIPDFHAEVWNHGKRDMRFRIIVGNNNILKDPNTGEKILDEDGEEQYPNRTPLQIAFLRYVVYNPYWNVPPRIKSEELDLHLEEDPNWYENNGYEIMYPDDPARTFVRQKPGLDNTLGRVKFIFPNPHNVFMHDTTSKRLFRLPIRAFSHGCMRVQDPLALAKYILSKDGQYDEEKIQEILNTEPYEEKIYVLKHALPIHIEYFNTRVDDQGHVAFLSDIYRYDKDAIAVRTRVLNQQLAQETRPNHQAESSP